MTGAVIIPVFADDSALEVLLQCLRGQSWAVVIVVVDGADLASTRTIAAANGCQYVLSLPGRGRQIRSAIEVVSDGMCLVLHADALVSEEMKSVWSVVSRSGDCWGRFDVAIAGLPVIAVMMNLRSRLTKICTGDQAMFFDTKLLRKAGGFSDLSLMEDIATSRRLKKFFPKKYMPLKETVGASPRRWRLQGVVRTIVSMWCYRLRFFFGADADELYRSYYSGKTR